MSITHHVRTCDCSLPNYGVPHLQPEQPPAEQLRLVIPIPPRLPSELGRVSKAAVAAFDLAASAVDEQLLSAAVWKFDGIQPRIGTARIGQAALHYFGQQRILQKQALPQSDENGAAWYSSRRAASSEPEQQMR